MINDCTYNVLYLVKLVPTSDMQYDVYFNNNDHLNFSSDPVSGPSPGVRNSFECDESDDDLRREEGINFAGDSGPLGASGRSISLDPGALGKK